MFALYRANQYVRANGYRAGVLPGNLRNLDSHVMAFLSAAEHQGGAQAVVGALPFDLDGEPWLYQPESFARGTGHGSLADVMPDQAERRWSPLQIVAEPDPAHYAGIVRRALDLIAQGEISKIVLARSLTITASQPVDPLTIAGRLARDPAVTVFTVPLPATPGGDRPVMVGATPELLVSRSGSNVSSHPLAGSAARSRDAASDREIADALLRSEKDRREHAMVAEAIMDCLTPVCTHLSAPEGMALHATATMWHLGTRISGVLKADAPSAAGLAALLHPTPAVGGAPRRAALDAIRRLEPHSRGFYAGAVGWTDAQGDGEWFVTLRCAEIAGRRLTLHAGAGIVAGSDPDAEVLETAAKFRAMLHALDMDESAELLEMVR